MFKSFIDQHPDREELPTGVQELYKLIQTYEEGLRIALEVDSHITIGTVTNWVWRCSKRGDSSYTGVFKYNRGISVDR